MRKSLFLLYCVFLQLTVFSQVKPADVPWAIKIQFMEDYISASKAIWEKQKDDRFTVNFYHQGFLKKATYSIEGRLLRVETKLTSFALLPEIVVDALTKRFKSHVVDQILKCETGQEIILDLLTRRNDRIYELKFLPSGKLISKVIIK